MPTGIWDEENNRFWPKNSLRGKELVKAEREKKKAAKLKEKATREAKYGIRMADCHPDQKHYIGGKCRACHEYKLYHGVDKPLESVTLPSSEPQPAPDPATPPGPGREPTPQEKIANFKRLGMEDLLFFGKNIMGYSLLNEEEHRELADFLMSPRKQFSIVAAPRDTLKTTLCSIVYPTWRMARGEWNLRVMLDSETRANAQARLRNIQDKMTGQWQMRTCFNDWNGRAKGFTWNDEEFNIAQRTDFSAKECNFEASGIDVVRNSRHYNLIIPDDLHSEKNSQTKDQIQNVVEHIRCLFPLLEEGGEMLFVCTFWDDNDAVRQIMEMMKDETSVFIRSAYKEDGSIRYPHRLPENRLKSARKLMGNYLYSCTPSESPVLMADFTTKPIGEIKVGDRVIGFHANPDIVRNDHAYGRRVLTETTVVANGSREASVYKIITKSGRTIRCTADHKWFTGRTGRDHHRQYAPARKGMKLQFVCEPSYPMLTEEQKHQASWLAGFFDGEGSIVNGAISFSQSYDKNPELCKKLEKVLFDLGFEYGRQTRSAFKKDGVNHSNTYWYYLKGGLDVKRRFLHYIPFTKWRDRLHENLLKRRGRLVREKDVVMDIVPDGVEPVYSMQTETGNYIVWGYASKNCQFLLDPVPKDSAMFREDDIQIVSRQQVPRNLRKFVLCDPAGDSTATTEAKKDSDNYAIGAIAVSPSGNIYLLDLAWGKFTPTEADEHMIRLIVAHNPHVSGIEKTGLGNMRHHVSEELRKMGRFALVDDLMPGGRSKFQRVSALEPVVKLRKLFIVDDCPYREEIINEFTRFPKAKHDDIIDMIAYVMDMVIKYGVALTDNEAFEQDDLDARLSGLDPRSRAYWEKFHGAEKKKKQENWVCDFV